MLTTMLLVLGAFLLGGAAVGLAARYFFKMGWELAHDDRRLEPGAVGSLPSEAPEPSAVEVTGPIRPVGVWSGRHALPDWPTPEDMPVRDEVTT